MQNEQSADPRMNWNDYFISIAKVVAKRSNCSRRHVGAVIVKDRHIVATGYNGTPHGTKNCFEGGCPRCNHAHKTGEALEECLCVHAEQNAICQAARNGNGIDGGTIYITCSPCLSCAKMLINAGIKRIVFDENYGDGINQQEQNMLEEAHIDIVGPLHVKSHIDNKKE